MTFEERARNPGKLPYKLWEETRDELRRRAKQGKATAQIQELLRGFETYDPEPGVVAIKKVGAVVWQDHDAGPLMRGFVDGEEVGWIFKHETHKPVNGPTGVYELSVLGEAVPERFHNVGRAREEGGRLYAERSGASG